MNSGHGWVYPREDGAKARCGGPNICPDCSLDYVNKKKESKMELKQKYNPEFAVHMLNDEGQKKAYQIQGSFDFLLNNLSTLCISGREFSIVKTKLEEACFFAKKAMAIHLDNQQLPERG